MDRCRVEGPECNGRREGVLPGTVLVDGYTRRIDACRDVADTDMKMANVCQVLGSLDQMQDAFAIEDIIEKEVLDRISFERHNLDEFVC